MRRMLPLALGLGATLGLLTAGGAVAQSGGMGVPGAGQGMSGPPVRSDAQGPPLREGMTVKDSAGVTVGKIAKVGLSGGAPAALVEVDGKTVVVMGSTLTVSGHTATSSQSKAEIEALPQPRPG